MAIIHLLLMTMVIRQDAVTGLEHGQMADGDTRDSGTKVKMWSTVHTVIMTVTAS